ncbi:proline racemase family protein [Paeniglutamicibacter psychrophenolicus]|uniref:Proline racemase/trans-L-3-hydroxyproline dehydratase n=1 Tax=Paeniglutamicibacter psychrophenolicus TaxID=257454 RepID=A0ABS4WA15_9MICC|nr:proline racemase family protein [Paeniglutamicibacter psychrophenolicus]MBP2373040.1 proline racemase/trans-L-3-hydroxyproline dehydratase [Paeniglutamicibacter psychrophenolicus]
MATASIQVSTIDYHTGGEPFRIVADGYGTLEGNTVAERRVSAQNSAGVDRIRQMLVQEPRGHTDMYGCFVTEPDDEGADFGAVFWHKDGYSTACGHGTMALGVWAVEELIVESDPNGTTVVVIDVPSGRVAAHVESAGGVVQRVTFENVPSYVTGQGLEVEANGRTFTVDLAYGGAIYACLDVAQLGMEITKENYSELRAIGRAVKWACNQLPEAQHPDPRLSGVYGTILFQKFEDLPSGPHQTNMTVFADGEVDRSPCGSGTSARLACLAASGEIDGRSLRHDSIVGSTFVGTVRPHDEAHSDFPAVIPVVTGMAYRTGRHQFELNPSDELGTGFILF